MTPEEFESYVSHVAGVMLQTLSIERGRDKDGAKHEVEMKEGQEAVWKIRFLMHKGTWKFAGSSRKEL